MKFVSINEFDKKFNLIQIYKSDKVNILNKEWIIINPTISIDNQSVELNENINIKTHFDQKKIRRLFKNLSALNMLELLKLNDDYRSLGYSTNEVISHLNKLLSFPVYVSIMTILSSILMLNINRHKPKVFHVILGIFLSVLIYYFYYLSSLLGQTQKIPLIASVWLPLLILTFFIFIGLIRVNEK